MGGGGHESEAPGSGLFREVQAFTNAALILFFAELAGPFPVLLHCGPLEPPERGLPAHTGTMATREDYFQRSLTKPFSFPE